MRVREDESLDCLERGRDVAAASSSRESSVA
jgi:hypothetical protein